MPDTHADVLSLLIGLERTARIRTWADEGVLDVVASATPERLPSIPAGIESRVVPIGYHPAMGTDRGQTRDIPVVFLGTVRERRAAILERFRRELAALGIPLLVVDRACFGEQRTVLLNRTVISINLASFDSGGRVRPLPRDRMLLSMGCGALVVSEPAQGLEPLVPGTHLVTATIEELPLTMARYLEKPEERRPIVEAAQRLITTELSMRNSARLMGELWRR